MTIEVGQRVRITVDISDLMGEANGYAPPIGSEGTVTKLFTDMDNELDYVAIKLDGCGSWYYEPGEFELVNNS